MVIGRTLVAVMSLLAVTACSTPEPNGRIESTGESVSPTTAPMDSPPEIEWRPCSTSDADCAVIEVPFDHDRPDIGTFDLPIARHRARVPEERIGVLFVNPGGPGSGGIWMAENADYHFSDVVVDRFDIIGWDPRGTGGARPELDCTDDMDSYFALDPSSDDDDDRTTLIDAARRFVDACSASSGEILPYVGTEATARDIDLIRRTLDEETVSYFGFSYGSELGATWVTLFPDTVRAAVFDASTDPNLDVIDWLTLQSVGFERSLEAFLDECDATACSFTTPGETARQAFDRILSDLESSPLRVDEARSAVGPGTALIAVFAALYQRSTWDLLDRALAEADDGFGDRLLTLYDGYFGGYRDGHPDDAIDAYVAITCLDRSRDFDVDDAFAAMDSVITSSPRLGATVLQELLLCAHWPVDPKPSPDVHYRGGVPILVLGSTGDPATPLEGTRRMYETLGNARLVVVDSFDHTSYGSVDCATRAVDRYLTELVIPDGEIDCQ